MNQKHSNSAEPYPRLEVSHCMILDHLLEREKTVDELYDELADWGATQQRILETLAWLHIHGLVLYHGDKYAISKKGRGRRGKGRKK